MIENDTAKSVPTFAVWVPKLGGEKKHIADATTVVPDPNAQHYWDDRGSVMAAYTKAMRLPEDAWDIYLVYGPDAEWTDEGPPKAEYWMHQLGRPGQERVEGPYLDAEIFAAKVAAAAPSTP